MASNRWLSNLHSLKTNMETLKETLKTRNISTTSSDTLTSLIGKTPLLAPITIEDKGFTKWEPDPKWVFPDPNGTEELKTIRQIYDEDTRKNSYSYYGIYMLSNCPDTLNIRAGLSFSSSVNLTIYCSDGTLYENSTSAINHTWDKTKDVIDSNGNRIRYLFCYSATASTRIPSFYCSLKWCVHNLGTSIMTTSGDSDFGSINNYAYSMYYCTPDCIELGTKVTTVSVYSSGSNYTYVIGNPKKLIFHGNTSIGNSYTVNGDYNSTLPCYLQEFEAPLSTSSSNIAKLKGTNVQELDISKMLSSNGSFNFTYFPNLKKLTGIKDNTCTTINFSNLYSNYLELEPFPETIRTLSLSRIYGIYTITIPLSVTSLTISQCYNLTSIAIPPNVTSLSLSNLMSLTSITIPSSVTTLTLSNLINLTSISVPLDFNFVLNLSLSIKLEKDSIIQLLENLKDLTGTSAKTLTLGAINLAKLTDEEKAIATNKNWTLA